MPCAAWGVGAQTSCNYVHFLRTLLIETLETPKGCGAWVPNLKNGRRNCGGRLLLELLGRNPPPPPERLWRADSMIAVGAGTVSKEACTMVGRSPPRHAISCNLAAECFDCITADWRAMPRIQNHRKPCDCPITSSCLLRPEACAALTVPRRGLRGPFEGRHQRLKPRPLDGIRDARPRHWPSEIQPRAERRAR